MRYRFVQKVAAIFALILPAVVSAQSAEDLLEQINRAASHSQAAPSPTTNPRSTAPAPEQSPSQATRPAVTAAPPSNTKTGSAPLNYYGLLPGQSTKADVELLLGDPIETRPDSVAYRPPAEAADAVRIEVGYFKNTRVVQRLDVLLRKPLLYVEIAAHAGRRTLVEKDGANWIWEFYAPSFLALGYAAGTDGPPIFIDRLRYVTPQMVADAFVRRGEKAESEKRADDAMTEYEKASKIDPRYAVPFLKLGMTYERSGARDKALLHYTAATEAAYSIRAKAEGHFRAGRIYDQMQQYDMALKAFNRAVAQDPSYPEGHFGVGRIHFLQDRLDQALPAYQKAVELKPDYVVAHDNLGRLHERKKNFREAVQSYETALQYDPKRGDTWHRLARVCLRSSDFARAENAARRRLSQQPDDPAAMIDLAMALSGQAPERPALLAFFQEDPQLKESLEWLDKAIARGYRDRPELENSPYLRQVREQESRSFNNLLAKIR